MQRYPGSKRTLVINDTFRKLVRDALEHFQDLSYLETHALTSQLLQPATSVQATRGQKLRNLLKDTLEKLRPQTGSPSSAPEWRSYLALRYRYIQSMSMDEIGNRLGISLRQIHRELHKGFEALCSLLWELRAGEEPPALASQELSPAVLELQKELNQWQPDRQACQTAELIDDTLALLNPLLDQRAIVLSVHLPADLAPLMVDAALVRQALFKTLRLIAQVTTGVIHLEIEQHDSQVDMHFRFEDGRLEPADDEWQMVALLAAHEGGQLIIADSATARRVTLRLPRASQFHVLVIDDNPSIHQLFERYLSLHHYKIAHARSGSEGLQMAVESQTDLILLDVMMPGMDGWQVLRDLGRTAATQHVPVIVCSVLKEPELALSLGAQAYLKKPVDRVELLETLARLLHPANHAEAGPSEGREDNQASR